MDPLEILNPWLEKKGARRGLSLLMVSTTGEHAAYYVLDEDLIPQPKPMPAALRPSVDLITENCEPALCTVMFQAGAGGSLRSGVTRNPVKLTRSVQALKTHVTCGGAPAYVWPGGGITLMVDVTRMPEGSFGYVPTPALVAPLEFTLPRADYRILGAMMPRSARFRISSKQAANTAAPRERLAPEASHEQAAGTWPPWRARGPKPSCGPYAMGRASTVPM